MAERHRRLLLDCRAASHVRRAGAQVNHAAAMLRETQAATAAQSAARALADATEDWERQLANRCDPLLGAILARALVAQVATTEEALALCRASSDHRAQAARDWHAAEARSRALDSEVAAAARKAERRADERQVAFLADRETFARSQG